MDGYIVKRPKDTVIVCILYNRADGKYHYVNLTHPHICPCAFDSVEDAIKDMDKQKEQSIVLSYEKTKIDIFTS